MGPATTISEEHDWTVWEPAISTGWYLGSPRLAWSSTADCAESAQLADARLRASTTPSCGRMWHVTQQATYRCDLACARPRRRGGLEPPFAEIDETEVRRWLAIVSLVMSKG